jgi:hypothetical protein
LVIVSLEAFVAALHENQKFIRTYLQEFRSSHVNGPNFYLDPLLLIVNFATQLVTCDLFSKSFNFRCLINIVRVGAVYTILDVSSEEIMARIHVRLTWWPGPPTSEALWKSIRQGMATRHIT